MFVTSQGSPYSRFQRTLKTGNLSIDGGFDLPSAGIGAAVPLTWVLIEVAGRWVLRRRRDTEVRHQLA